MCFVHVTISDKKHKKIIEISIKKWAFKGDVFSLPPSNKLQGMVQGSAIFPELKEENRNIGTEIRRKEGFWTF